MSSRCTPRLRGRPSRNASWYPRCVGHDGRGGELRQAQPRDFVGQSPSVDAASTHNSVQTNAAWGMDDPDHPALVNMAKVTAELRACLQQRGPGRLSCTLSLGSLFELSLISSQVEFLITCSSLTKESIAVRPIYSSTALGFAGSLAWIC